MRKAIAERPWIWIIVGSALMMSAIIAGLVISIKHAPQEIPLRTIQSEH